jgi:hypothetical protein
MTGLDAGIFFRAAKKMAVSSTAMMKYKIQAAPPFSSCPHLMRASSFGNKEDGRVEHGHDEMWCMR